MGLGREQEYVGLTLSSVLCFFLGIKLFDLAECEKEAVECCSCIVSNQFNNMDFM